MTRVEFDRGEEAFTVGKRSSSIGKRRGSIVSSSKGGRVVKGIAGSVGIARMHLVIQQGDYCSGKKIMQQGD